MNEEIVSVLLHSPKQERKNVTPNTRPMSHGGTRNGKPSRRWLISELEKTVKRNTDLCNQLKIRDEVERSLIETKTQLERELALFKSRRAMGTHENEAIRERNKQLSQDIFLMKNIVVKLNAELEWYQGKMRKYEKEAAESGKEINFDIGRRQARDRRWMDGELSIFAPLVNAYEESLHEKEQLIQDQRDTLQRFSGKLKEIITENTELREKIAESEKQGEVSYSDWIGVQREMALTSEQNLLLKRQANLSQAKISQLKVAYETKLREASQDRDDSRGNLAALREEHLLLKGRNSALEQEHQRLKEEVADRIPKSVHSAYITECKRLLDELKSRHEEERDSLLKRVCTHDSNTSQINESQRIRDLERSLGELESRCVRSERKRDVLKVKLDSLIIFSKELILEHENLLKALGGELGMNTALAARLDTIKRQLQGVEAETRDQIKLLDENIACQVERVNRKCSQQKNEIDRLRQQLLLKPCGSQETTELVQ